MSELSKNPAFFEKLQKQRFGKIVGILHKNIAKQARKQAFHNTKAPVLTKVFSESKHSKILNFSGKKQDQEKELLKRFKQISRNLIN